MDYQKLIQEVREIRMQAKADFEFTAAGFGDMARQMAELSRRMGEMEGRTRLQEVRFERILVVVEDVLQSATQPFEFLDLVRRVEILEAKTSAA